MNIFKKLTNLFDRNYGLEEDFQDYCYKHKCRKEYWGNGKYYCPACGEEYRKKRKE